ncbi:hypothetical protein SARC_06674 [Sphaeroforma arctica JP610]|uniref:Uncharacterized protein n=1 Tax=Sphaeroforma arctica JP610 TaxID=667725 RepID=A0A0L0FYD8_9EUKA|nr:hypothetical protein SARC_06674 [Sphaeroforma arctica JP610]KNC80983.1 hypothetical protein SARC_06674 [Sphaeroforma arctica JP610]|eukprot:XP_014154885.1 hypothetical protein SARC_06674 [Sphaeroforma arctica JP610]
MYFQQSRTTNRGLSYPQYSTTGRPSEVMDPRGTYCNGQMESVPGRMNQTSQMLMFLHYTVNALDANEGNQGRRNQQQ